MDWNGPDVPANKNGHGDTEAWIVGPLLIIYTGALLYLVLPILLFLGDALFGWLGEAGFILTVITSFGILGVVWLIGWFLLMRAYRRVFKWQPARSR